MKLRRPIRASTLILPMLAAVASVAPAAAAADRHPAGPALTGVSWQGLTLLNGWQNKPGSGVRQASWALRNGIVYLTGLIGQPSGTGTVVAQLPAQARPAKTQRIEVPAATSGTAGYLTISATGAISVGPEQYAGERTGTVLGGVSFPAANAARHPLTTVNGWKIAAGGGAPAYTVADGMVHLSGDLAHTGPVTNKVFATLPAGERPASNQYIEVYTQGGISGELIVGSNGKLTAQWGMSPVRVSLGGATFPLASTTIKPLTLINHWTTAAGLGTGTPGYASVSGIVCLSGALNGAASTSSLFANLPSAIQPAHKVFTAADIKNGAGALIGILRAPTGKIGVETTSQASAKQMTSLASVCYPVNS